MSPWEGPRQGRHSEEGPHGPYFNKIITFRAQGAKKPSALSASLFHTFHFSFIHSQAHTLCLLFSLSLSLSDISFLPLLASIHTVYCEVQVHNAHIIS